MIFARFADNLKLGNKPPLPSSRKVITPRNMARALTFFRNGNRWVVEASETTNQPARPPRNRARYETKLARS